MSAADTHRAIEAVWRIESVKIVGSLARIVRDVGIAEELSQDSLVLALKKWPRAGIPDNPAAWLMAAAKRRAIDRLRRGRMLERKHREIGRELEALQEMAAADLSGAPADLMGDDVLRLAFTACHPVLSSEARVALTLRLLGGLRTEEIARAFLTSEATIAQRIVRAKKALARSRVPFETPQGPERRARLDSVLEVLYLIFNEGYAATSGEHWMRPALCDEALRMGRVLTALMPDEPEVHGLLALMEIQASRLRARTGPAGEPILLLDQDRSGWDALLVQRGLAGLAKAETLSASRGPYTLQAAIAACHARARTAEETDWMRIAALYAALAQVQPSPVIELNRAMAVGMALGPAAGLAILDPLLAVPELSRYHLLPAARGDLLARLGRTDEARSEFERAAGQTENLREAQVLLARARSCGPSALPGPH